MNQNILLHPEIVKTRVQMRKSPWDSDSMEETEPESQDSQILIETIKKPQLINVPNRLSDIIRLTDVDGGVEGVLLEV
jgi:hypothetical protein